MTVMSGLSWAIRLLHDQIVQEQPVMHILTYRLVQRETIRKHAQAEAQRRYRARQGESVPRPQLVEKLVNLDWQGD